MPAGEETPSPGRVERDPVTLPLWVQVTKDGLETRIVFHGEWVFTNHLPQEVQVRVWYFVHKQGLKGPRTVSTVRVSPIDLSLVRALFVCLCHSSVTCQNFCAGCPSPNDTHMP